jgi:hypothetical protein
MDTEIYLTETVPPASNTSANGFVSFMSGACTMDSAKNFAKLKCFDEINDFVLLRKSQNVKRPTAFRCGPFESIA